MVVSQTMPFRASSMHPPSEDILREKSQGGASFKRWPNDVREAIQFMKQYREVNERGK
jgi:hypothetical protein